MFKTLLITSTLLVSLVIQASSKTDPVGIEGNNILIGEYGSMTGGEATFGISTHEGIELAFKEINAKGGVKGKQLKLISLDDQGKADEAATAVQKLITQNKVSYQ